MQPTMRPESILTLKNFARCHIFRVDLPLENACFLSRASLCYKSSLFVEALFILCLQISGFVFIITSAVLHLFCLAADVKSAIIPIV